MLSRRQLLQSSAIGAGAMILGDCPVTARPNGLPRAHPESVGVSPVSVMGFIDAVEQKVGGLHSFMLLRHGKVAAEGWWNPYRPEYPHMLFSLSKSFTSTAVGFAVTTGLLTVDSPVTSFFKDELPAKIDDNLTAMHVKHLLTMNTGHDKDATGPTTQAKDGNWVREFLSLPVEHAPGSKFVYNSAATYMLSAIVQKLTGQKVVDYLQPRLFRPLGIAKPTWETCPKGINTGGWGLNIHTEDIARFGQLYLQKGMWNDKQIIPSAWVDEATSKQVSNGTGDTSDWTQGYGYQFWRCRHNVFRGDGAFGQYCIVMPPNDAVLAITSGVGDMQAVLNAVWDNLLPGFDSTASGRSSTDLDHKIRSLSVTPPAGKETSTAVARVSGKTYKLESNEAKFDSIRVRFEGDRCNLTFASADGSKDLSVGGYSWIQGVSPFPQTGRFTSAAYDHAACRGAWSDDNTYEVRMCLVETPFIQTIALHFDSDSIKVERKVNVGFGPTTMPTLVGKVL